MENTLETKMVESRPVDHQPEGTRSIPTSGSTDPHEFLQMRARQRVARARIRRWKMAGTVLVVSGVLIGGVATTRWHRPQLARVPAAAPVLASAAISLPPLEVLPVQPAAAPPAENQGTPCEQDFAQHQWKAAIDSCTRAFEGEASAAVALRIAHAQWSHGQPMTAGKWAARALELGSTDADAFVLIGHSERQAGHARAARVAYHRYLRRAPHGWHAVRVRAALRELASRSRVVSSAD
jgi:hypothetical protein